FIVGVLETVWLSVLAFSVFAMLVDVCGAAGSEFFSSGEVASFDLVGVGSFFAVSEVVRATNSAFPL
ncbi:hypothetical protein ABTD22_20905, partial [Acinetobacter baumannii]